MKQTGGKLVGAVLYFGLGFEGIVFGVMCLVALDGSMVLKNQGRQVFL